MQPFERPFPFATGPKRSANGGEKNFFIRGAEPTPQAVLRRVNPCQSLSNRFFAQGRYYTRASAYRKRRRFKHFWPISLSSRAVLAIKGQGLLPGLSKSTLSCIDGVCVHRRPPTIRPTSRGRRDLPRKKCAFWTRWRPVPVKKTSITRGPQ